MGGMKIIKGGLLSTVQDGGRIGYQQYGVPVSGVMDFYAYRLGNILVRNREDAAVIEVTMMGFAAEFLEESIIAVTGGDLTPTLNSRPIGMWETISVVPGDKLAFQRVRSGCRSYVAIAGGIDVPKVMDSRSTYRRGGFGGYRGRALQNGDELKIGKGKEELKTLTRRSLQEHAMEYPSEITIRVVAGPQEEAFKEEGITDFYNGGYKVTMESDRMGFRLEGEKIVHRDKSEIISDGIAMGAIQVPGHGLPILMMADRQTSGGYPKIANVITADLPKLAQAKSGDTLRFQKVTVEEAQEAFGQMEQGLKKMKESLARDLERRKSIPDNYETVVSKRNGEDSGQGRGISSINEESLKPGQRKFVVRINGKEYTVLVEEREIM